MATGTVPRTTAGAPSNSDLFSGKLSLLFHRNMLDVVSVWGERVCKDFQAETGIQVKSDFVNRSMYGMRLKFNIIKLDKHGSIDERDFHKKMNTFMNSRKNYLKQYIALALRCTIDNKSVQQELRALDPERPDDATQWMGDSIKVSNKDGVEIGAGKK